MLPFSILRSSPFLIGVRSQGAATAVAIQQMLWSPGNMRSEHGSSSSNCSATLYGCHEHIQRQLGGIRGAKKKAGGSSTNGRESPGRRLGIKVWPNIMARTWLFLLLLLVFGYELWQFRCFHVLCWFLSIVPTYSSHYVTSVLLRSTSGVPQGRGILLYDNEV
jgi:Ribosomal L27 protein